MKIVRPEKYVCPECASNRGVLLDSRPVTNQNVTRRRRYSCAECGHRWTTNEMIVGHDQVGYAALQIAALQFLKEVDESARKAFGDSDGKFAGLNKWSRK